MLAVGQPISLRSDPRGDAPGFDDDGRWPKMRLQKRNFKTRERGKNAFDSFLAHASWFLKTISSPYQPVD
tara:strand:- start:10028 stop:10237 length:210 start_codon:yes stop_codon:yes gene_type:complete